MIKFLDLKKINQQYEDEIKLAIDNVVGSGWYINGSQVEAFEKSMLNLLE